MLRQRVLTAVVLASVIASALLLLDTEWIGLLMGLVMGAAAIEWARLAGIDGLAGRSAYALLLAMAGLALWVLAPRPQTAALVAAAACLWWLFIALRMASRSEPEDFLGATPSRLLAGALTLLPAWYLLVSLHESRPHGPVLTLYAMMLVWIADVCAYFAGKRFGRRKLAPHISPGKTVEGALGAMLGALAWGLLGALWLAPDTASGTLFALIALLAAAFSITGDLFESVLKRLAGAKDSGSLLPGHGGMLDRIDSMTAAVPVFVLGLLLMGGVW